jgi:hypothetical protein
MTMTVDQEILVDDFRRCRRRWGGTRSCNRSLILSLVINPLALVPGLTCLTRSMTTKHACCSRVRVTREPKYRRTDRIGLNMYQGSS